MSGLAVRDFGAKGNGTTEDTDAVQRAHSTAEAEKLVLGFSPGNYLITGTIATTRQFAWRGTRIERVMHGIDGVPSYLSTKIKWRPSNLSWCDRKGGG